MSNLELEGIVQSAPNKSLGFDADSKILRATARAFHEEGYKFCVRYVSLGAESPADLTHEEANDILEEKLALMPVQHVPEPGWFPNAELGKQHGENAAINSKQVGFPSGVNVWCDLEGINSAVSAQDVINYCNTWYDEVASEQYGYLPGLYVGANSILNGEQLYELKFQHFWRSESEVPDVAVRNYQMVQSYVAEPVNGIGIDRDVTYIDNKGGRPQWLIRP